MRKCKVTGRSKNPEAKNLVELGRSALGAVEAMNMMTNLLREHVPEKTRLHYIISDGGKPPLDYRK